MIAPARAAAWDVLRAVSGGRQDLPSALAAARASLTDERDRALTGEIATGTLRWQSACDHLIVSFANRPLSRLDAEIADILRMSIFQLLHLTRVPASAVVDDAVNLARKVGKKSAAPLVNAVLRRVSRERSRLPLPTRRVEPREAALDYLSVTLSHPRWLVGRWIDRHGFDAVERWCQFNNGPAALTLRANRLTTTRDRLAAELRQHGVKARPTRYAPDGLTVDEGNPLLTPLNGTGLFVVQDEASQLVALMTGVRAGERIYDACASPGGKTTAMAADIGDRGLIVAADVRARRVRLLARTVRRSGATCVHIVQADAAAPAPFSTAFDCVLLDAPCSGLGTVRRDPDIKWRRSERELAENARHQLRLLQALTASVGRGGRLVYATCSSEPEENEQVVSAFLKEHPEFARYRPTSTPPEMHELLDDYAQLRTLPFRDGLEAFFAAALVRRSSA